LFSHVERPAQASPSWRSVRADAGAGYLANGFVGWLFSATAPVAIILSVGTAGGLSETQLASWLFGVFFVNGLITVVFSWRYRQPLAFFWTIPGTVLVGPALAHLSFAEVVGAFYATGALVLLLGATGWVRRVMQALPMPIVMAMVAGVFLRFGLDLVRSLHADFAIAGPMALVWLVAAVWPALGKRLPPLIGALLAGVVAAVLLGRIDAAALGAFEIARPLIQAPAWSLPAMIELVVPLAITVIVIQNGQGVAVLRAAGHNPPVNAITLACGVGALASAAVGSVSTCLTGPTNAILTSSVHRRHRNRGLRDGVRPARAGVHAADAGHAESLRDDPRRAGDADRPARCIRCGIQRPLHARCVGHVAGDGGGPRPVQHRRCVLGARGGCGGVVAARARRLPGGRSGCRRGEEPDLMSAARAARSMMCRQGAFASLTTRGDGSSASRAAGCC
jgi:benzoate membrane transport protein